MYTRCHAGYGRLVYTQGGREVHTRKGVYPPWYLGRLYPGIYHPMYTLGYTRHIPPYVRHLGYTRLGSLPMYTLGYSPPYVRPVVYPPYVHPVVYPPWCPGYTRPERETSAQRGLLSSVLREKPLRKEVLLPLPFFGRNLCAKSSSFSLFW